MIGDHLAGMVRTGRAFAPAAVLAAAHVGAPVVWLAIGPELVNQFKGGHLSNPHRHPEPIGRTGRASPRASRSAQVAFPSATALRWRTRQGPQQPRLRAILVRQVRQ
jgi:hypothetical protein